MIPIDGKVIGGNAAVNQASVTGENLAVRKETGDRVLSGTVLEAGRLRIRATRVGAETTTARIARFIENALQQQSRTQSLAEQLADRRVYLTLGTGALVYVATRDLDRLASVFLVDYACALKLGTPVAIKSAMYQGAKYGVLFRSSLAIDSLARIDTFVFDKTGTLTSGLLEVTDVVSLDADWDERRLLALVASIEEHASHPVADAVVKQARREHLGHIEYEDVDYLVAHGFITTHAEGRCVVIGSRHFLEAHRNISFATHLARATADIVLLDEHLQTLLAARTLSVGTLRLIRNHFHISTGVNTAVIAGAAFDLLSPVWSALLHNGMTLGVLLNSIAGVSLKTGRLEAFQDRLETLKAAYQSGH